MPQESREVHRSIIVNVNRVRALELTGDGDYAVIVKCEARLRLTRRFRKPLLLRLGVAGKQEVARK